MNKRYVILLSTLFIASLAIYVINKIRTSNKSTAACVIKQDAPVTYDADPATYAYYTQDLQELEQEAWDALEQAGVSKDTCMQKKEAIYALYLQDLENIKNNYGCEGIVSTATCELVQSIADDFGIDTSDMELVPWDLESAAAATDKVFFINEKMLNQHCPQAKRFIIGHEMQHVIHQDHSTQFTLRTIAQEQTVSADAFNALSRFFETRADTLAALKNDDYAFGSIECMQKNLEALGENEGLSHPKTSSRLQRGKQIVAMKMQNAQATAVA